MRKLACIIFLFFSAYHLVSQTFNADAVVGTWLTASGKAKVDKNNPDKSKQSVPLVGLSMLKGFVFDKDEWEDGAIYDLENGKTYSCYIKYRNGKLDLRGGIGISLIGAPKHSLKSQTNN